MAPGKEAHDRGMHLPGGGAPQLVRCGRAPGLSPLVCASLALAHRVTAISNSGGEIKPRVVAPCQH